MEGLLESLYRKRKDLHRELQEIGEFRRGIISEGYRKCGKPNCACAKEGHPGHGPRYLWNTTIKGKSYAKHIRMGPELQKYLDETENHRRFVKVCEEIVAVNEQICDLRPVPEVTDEKELAELKKKLQEQFSKKYKKR